MSDRAETAILAGGCFWPAQELLRHREGVISTRVGYTGGENDNPTDENHSGHAEAVEIVFDPERISYRELLEFFFQIHRPDLGEDLVGSSYRSEIFYTTDEQRRVAEDTIADLDAAAIWPGKVVTEVSEAGPFWEAEAEDQDYLQHYPDGYAFFPRPGLDGVNDYVHINLAEIEDVAPANGFGDRWQARVARGALGAQQTGVTHFRLLAGRRSPFVHRHTSAEEIYVILAGNGRLKLDDDIIDVRALDAVRVDPAVARAFEAGSDGLEFLAFGPHDPGDGEPVDDDWVK